MAYLLFLAAAAALVGAGCCFSLARKQPAPWRQIDEIFEHPGSPTARRLIGMDPNERGVYPVRVSHGMFLGLIGVALIVGGIARLNG